jgi:MIP family channel proteins
MRDCSMAVHGKLSKKQEARFDALDKPQPHSPWTYARYLLAEAVGTFALTFVAAGGDAIAQVSGGAVSEQARATAPGLLVMAFIYAIGNVSGAHFNPAVTLAFALRRACTWQRLVPYWIAQVIGAVLAGAFLVWLFGPAAAAGVNEPHLGVAVAVAMEICLTTILVLVVLGTATRYQLIGPEAAIAVGATIVLCGLVGLPVSGASMNPARSVGPALATGQLGSVCIYLLAPIIGAILGVLITACLHSRRHAEEKEAAMGDH